MRICIVEIWGGFHDQMKPIRIKVPSEYLGTLQRPASTSTILDAVSPRVRKRVEKHMCGIKGCICGPHHGWKWMEV